MTPIRWADVIAECGNYKAGFVAVFRRYEGMPTDEIVRGKAMKVTAKSFAEHVGVPVPTFHRWVRMVTDLGFSSREAQMDRTAASHANVAKNLAKRDPEALADAVELASPEATDRLLHELTMRRAGVPRPPVPTRAEAKAREAHAHETAESMFAPVRRAIGDTIPSALDDLSEEIQEYIAKDLISGETMAAIEDAAERLLTVVRAGKSFVR